MSNPPAVPKVPNYAADAHEWLFPYGRAPFDATFGTQSSHIPDPRITNSFSDDIFAGLPESGSSFTRTPLFASPPRPISTQASGPAVIPSLSSTVASFEYDVAGRNLEKVQAILGNATLRHYLGVYDFARAIQTASKNKDKNMVLLLLKYMPREANQFAFTHAINVGDVFLVDLMLKFPNTPMVGQQILMRVIEMRNLALLDKILLSDKFAGGYYDNMDAIFAQLDAEGRVDIINRLIRDGRFQYTNPMNTRIYRGGRPLNE